MCVCVCVCVLNVGNEGNEGGEQVKKCLPELRTLILEESSCNVLA